MHFKATGAPKQMPAAFFIGKKAFSLQSIIVFFIVLFACTLGASSGLGGGIIIKPLMDAMGGFSAASVNAMSSITILTMTTVSIYKSRYNARFVDWRMVIFFTIGSMLGGIAGNQLLANFIAYAADDNVVTIVQSVLQILIVVLVMLHEIFGDRIPHFHLKNRLAMTLIGVVLGTIAAFLSIGGGIFNRPLLVILLSLSHRSSVFTSLCIIFCAQFADVVTMGVTTHFANVVPGVVPFMMVGAILGGSLGGSILACMNEKYLDKIFMATLTIILCLNGFNLLRHLFFMA